MMIKFFILYQNSLIRSCCIKSKCHTFTQDCQQVVSSSIPCAKNWTMQSATMIFGNESAVINDNLRNFNDYHNA